MNKELRNTLNELDYDGLKAVQAHVVEALVAARAARKERLAEARAVIAENTIKRSRGGKAETEEAAPKKKKKSKKNRE